MCSSDVFLGFLALLFPPIAVWVKCGICSADSIINILLCCLGYLPGLIHAWYIIAKFPEPAYYYDYEPVNQGDEAESGRVTYVFVNGPPPRQARPLPKAQGQNQDQNQAQGQQGGNVNYGTAGQSSSGHHQPEQHGGEGSSGGAPPPSYAAAVSGDHKVQTQD